ncbi:RNA-directed DNA polymerase [Exiguobacterium sp.]|uniref:RNA-directed DNA polymerase n=1 Tax=Exiguobacterium sp. TaxID=44751 RepID=UPI00263B5D54|nr:RNA-directed DNA polymerase [Exiguobacterium sp.]MCC5893575.1 RNA-directed DNA polymerase [Exiguobacterium sp.]
MKRYSDFFDEIDDTELFDGLLGYGMFNEKLPPMFTSIPFLDFCKSTNPTFSNTSPKQSFIYYEAMRNINIPRGMGIPTPMSYYKLCKSLADNWGGIQLHFREKTQNEIHKTSRIHLRKKKKSHSLFEMNYKSYKTDDTPTDYLVIGNKYVVNADISTCFPSIYSHSVPWALVGKDLAKQSKSNSTAWYDQIDFNLRNTTHGETHGILIGPHSSNLIAEIVLVCIDQTLVQQGWKFIRNIDDYTCYTSSYEEGQKFLISLATELRKFKLVLNHKKTKILPLPIASTEDWVRKLNLYSNRNHKNYMDYKDVQAYLDLAISLMAENQYNASILNYAIKVISKQTLTKNAVDYLKNSVFHLVIIYPYLISLVEDHLFIPFRINQNDIYPFTNLLYEEGVRQNNHEIICYAIYFSLKYNFMIENLDYVVSKESNNCILLLLSFLYAVRQKDNAQIKNFKAHARDLQKNDDELQQNWLFIFEALPFGSLKGDWKKLKQANVSFVNI